MEFIVAVYLKSRMGVNLSDNRYREDEYERLLRVLHGEPIQPPPIGNKPDFTKKSGSGIKAGVSLDPTGAVSGGSPTVGSALGPTNRRPNAVAHAQYDKPGVTGPWESAHVRLGISAAKNSLVLRYPAATSTLEPKTKSSIVSLPSIANC